MGHQGIDFRHLRAAIAVAEKGTFTKAAIGLHMTQPNLSKQVQELEDYLGGIGAILNFGSSPYIDPYLVSVILSVRLPNYPKLSVRTHSARFAVYGIRSVRDQLAGRHP